MESSCFICSVSLKKIRRGDFSILCREKKKSLHVDKVLKSHRLIIEHLGNAEKGFKKEDTSYHSKFC